MNKVNKNIPKTYLKMNLKKKRWQ